MEALLTTTEGYDLTLIKIQLQGSNFKKLLKEKKAKKYRIAKDCGITYRTLFNWQAGKTKPSNELALRVGKYLGLIKPNEANKQDLIRRLDKIREEINRLG